MKEEIQSALIAKNIQIKEIQKLLKKAKHPASDSIIKKVEELCLEIEDELGSEYIVAPTWDDLGFPHLLLEIADGYGHRNVDSRREIRRRDLSIMHTNDDMGLVYVDIFEWKQQVS